MSLNVGSSHTTCFLNVGPPSHSLQPLRQGPPAPQLTTVPPQGLAMGAMVLFLESLFSWSCPPHPLFFPCPQQGASQGTSAPRPALLAYLTGLDNEATQGCGGTPAHKNHKARAQRPHRPVPFLGLFSSLAPSGHLCFPPMSLHLSICTAPLWVLSASTSNRFRVFLCPTHSSWVQLIPRRRGGIM